MSERGSAGRPTALLAVAALVVIAAGVKAAEQLMVPLLLSAFLATIAATPVFWLQRFRVPKGAAIAAVFLGLVATLVGVGTVVAQSVAGFRARLPVYQQGVAELQETLFGFLARMGVEITPEVLNPGVVLGFVGDAIQNLVSLLSNGLVILLTVIFILAEAWSFPRKLGKMLADPGRDLPHFARFAENVNRYIGIKTVVSVATGVFVTLALWWIGVDFPVLWGLCAFMLNYIPTIGSIIAAVPPVLLAQVQLGVGSAGATLAVFLVVNLVMGNVVEPRFMGRGLGLSTLAVFLSLVFWNWMFGPVGMLLSVPLTMTAKIALEANPSTEWIAHILDPAEPGPGEEAREEAPEEAAAPAENDP